MVPKVLVVDDSDFTAVYLEGLLGDRYQITHCADGESGVREALRLRPSIILMDVEMPGMDGYTACRQLKRDPATRDIPVIFLSAHIAPTDRFAGYEAGGDDYMTKPFDPDELCLKIAMLLRDIQQRKQLTQQISVASNTAMTALSTIGDSGIVIRFLRDMMGCLDFAALAESILRCMHAFHLEVSLQLRDGDAVYSISNDGPCSPLEISVLDSMANAPRIVDLGPGSAFNYSHVTILVKEMPQDTPEHYGRVKDNLASIAEAVDFYIAALNRMQQALQRGDTLLELLRNSLATLQAVEARYQVQRQARTQTFNALSEDFERSFVTLGLSEVQAQALRSALRLACDASQAPAAQGIEEEKQLQALIASFVAALQREAAAAATAQPSAPVPASLDDGAIELF